MKITVQRRLGVAVAALVLLGGCASADLTRTLASVDAETASISGGGLQLSRNAEDRATARQEADRLLAAELDQQRAVQLALANSPALQSLLAGSLAGVAEAAQGGRIANPVFAFERVRLGDELEIGRLLSFGLLDLLTLPQRKRLADRRIEAARLQLAGEVVDQVTAVRQAWVRAVAAGERLVYARQVMENAETAAELARRMEAAGNFNRLARARHQLFYANATTQLALAMHQQTASRETLIRLLGLDDGQAERLRLPSRLPGLPDAPLAPQVVGDQGTRGRLDLRLARAELDAAASAQGLNLVTGFTDVEFGLRRDTVFDNADGDRATARGWELELRLPLFDWGDQQRAAMNARTLAAATALEATARAAGSQLRESYSAYRTAHDTARHYRDEILPLHQTIAEENLLRYNGMLIGIFELLAESRAQIAAVGEAIAAGEQHALAAVALQASLIGKPVGTARLDIGAPAAAGPGGGH